MRIELALFGKMGLVSLSQTREGLIGGSLVAYEFPLYQILSLPPEPVSLPSREERGRRKQEMAHYYLKGVREGLQ